MEENIMKDIFSLSPYDESFPTRLLQEAFEFSVEQAQITTEKIYNDLVVKPKYPGPIPKAGTEKLRLVVDSSDDMIHDYKNGVIKLAREKGHLVAQIRNKGSYGSKLAVKEEYYVDGSSPMDLQNALQIQALHEALATISEQIQAIDENVKEILTGQQNDRLGLYYSGVALFIEAHNVMDESFQKELTAQSLKALSDAIFQLTLTLQSDISYLARCEYNKDKKHMYNLINEKIDNINRSFMAIHQASIMKAAIYCRQGELKAMATVLQAYERFIKGTIVSNAEMLSLCDAHDDGKLTGIWKRRANLQLEVSSIMKELQEQKQVLFIERIGD